MCSLPVFVGMDYHDSSVRVFVQDTDGSEMANADRANDWKAIADFGDRFGRPVRAAIESCCGAADLAEELVSCAGWSVDLAHPGYVQRMKQNPDKTDCQDAQLLADLERVRDQGHAIDDEENSLGARCVGAPIFDAMGTVTASLGVSGTLTQMDEANLPRIMDALKETARRISRQVSRSGAA